MYTHARRLGHVDLRRHDFDLVATARCQSYLAAISALMLVDTTHRWISCTQLHEQSVRSTLPVINVLADICCSFAQLPDRARRLEHLGLQKPILLSIDDIKKEYTQSLARLELVASLPELSTSGAFITQVLMFYVGESDAR